jgi:hypothetical protein
LEDRKVIRSCKNLKYIYIYICMYYIICNICIYLYKLQVKTSFVQQSILLKSCHRNKKKSQKRKKKKKKKADLVLANSYSFAVLEKITRPTSASHRIASSFAFLISPFRLFEKVTCLLVELSIL